MKSSFLMSSVDAANEPTLTTPLLVIAMPLGLTSSTVPGALIWPAMVDGVAPVTRFSVADAALGWLKLTVPPLPTENESQLRIARALDWLMLRVPGFGALIVALPAVTELPVGKV